jgi:hypothetical protein
MSLARGLKMRQGDLSTFDPTDRLGSMIGWWQVERGLVKSGSAFASLTDLSGNGHPGLPVAGKNLPAIVAADAALGNKPSIGFSKDGTGQPVLFAGVVLHVPFTVYLAAYMGSDVGAVQIVFDGAAGAVGNYPRLYTYAGGPPDSLVMIGTNQLLTGINLTASAFALCAIFDSSGNLSGASKNSETLDATLDLGNMGATGFVVGIDRSYTPVYAWDGRMAELIIMAGRDTKTQARDMLGYLQGRYPFAIDFDPPGNLYREKFALALDANPSFYPVRGLAQMVTPLGAVRLYTRFTPSATFPGHIEYEWAQHNAGAGPQLTHAADGTLTVTSGGVSYATELGCPQDTAHDVEYFCAVGGGVVPELAWRCDGPGGAWLPLPLVGAAAMAAITASGNINLGGDASGNSVVGTFRETVAFTDGAGPAGYLKKSYPAGVLAILGGVHGTAAEAGAWPQIALAATTKAYPRPRMPGTVTTATYETLNTAVATYTALVVGGSTLNVAIVAGGGYGSIFIAGDSAATAYSALQTLCTSLRAGGFNTILVMTVPPATGLTDATRLALNASIDASLVSGGYADAVCDWAADATIGATGVYSNATYFSSSRAFTLKGGRIAGALAAATLNAVLP